ncbi:putative mitochondrial protein [Symbiodinium microadriaticum]|uniref:Putative mitochondrial protein n=1 Tax=Symbiodinium microadriaticum TaxID=2951 RepID=A0A1Q9CFC1_SYMMI|nr:putative mitochondrial protein [Symbiodinium microadriaticum]CAE7727098.1 true [Symbiodinium sp. KB8]
MVAELSVAAEEDIEDAHQRAQAEASQGQASDPSWAIVMGPLVSASSTGPQPERQPELSADSAGGGGSSLEQGQLTQCLCIVSCEKPGKRARSLRCFHHVRLKLKRNLLGYDPVTPSTSRQRGFTERESRRAKYLRFFLHEHPQGTKSWEEPLINELRKDTRVYEIAGPMCKWELEITRARGTVIKRTRWFTNSRFIAAALSGVCSHTRGKTWRRNVALVNGRVRTTQEYPPKLVMAVLGAFRSQLAEDGEISKSLNAVGAGPVPDVAPVGEEEAEAEWFDRLPANAGAELNPQEVAKARAEELAWVHRQKLYEKEEQKAFKVRLLDISRAHFYRQAKREIYVTLPRDGVVHRSVAERGVPTLLPEWPAIFYNPATECRLLVLHGDDFVVLGDDDAQQHVEKALRTKYDLRVDGSIGVGETKQEFTVLNRLVSFDERSSTVSYEPDPRHAEIIVKDLGLESAKAVKSPNEKLKAEELDRRAKLHPVEPAEASRYRSLVMRAAFLAQDRPDLSETVKCLARKMQAPTEADFSDLKRLQRYLRGAMRVVQKSQRFSDVLTVHADSDFAGCLLTRKSTTGITCFYGKHSIRHRSTLQSTVSLSSGEAEFYALVKGVASGI